MTHVLVSASELATHLGDPRWRVVDCRHDLADPGAGRRAFEAGHVPGALFASLDGDLSGPATPASGRHPLPDSATFVSRCRAWGISRDGAVVAYDASGGAWAARLWWLLADHGHAAAYVLDGGLPAWLAAGGALQSGPAVAPPPGDFDGSPGHRPVVTAAEIASHSPVAWRLLDARDGPRYRGETEPVDARAGHIPGALSAPFKESLAPDGRLLPPDALRARFAALLAGRPPAEVVAYCGSGVTACHLLLALEAAGLGAARLYPGSWSEWIRDPTRPVRLGDEP
ncbi:MAG TPA: sulfurtransferase [Myxococcota bacterium]|jgi:thiosulfate/3-mercaptopyruvate sulfurtransferase|nr:sulfurtransferase [Myxococcota bacterium]